MCCKNGSSQQHDLNLYSILDKQLSSAARSEENKIESSYTTDREIQEGDKKDHYMTI